MASAAYFSASCAALAPDYERDLLVRSFVVRQWSPWLRGSATGLPETVQIARRGMETYYQTARSLARPVMKRDFIALDLGCATGRMACELVWSGAKRAIAVDKSPSMLRWAKKIVWGAASESVSVPVPVSASLNTACCMYGIGLRTRTDFVVADAQEIPLPGSSADLICCMNLLHRVPRPDRVLGEIDRVLKPGGYLLASNDYDWNDAFTPDRSLWFDDLWDVLRHGSWEKLDEIESVPYEAPVHERKVTRAMNHLMLLRKLGGRAV